MTRIIDPKLHAAALAFALGGCGSDIMHIDDLEVGSVEGTGGQQRTRLRGSFRVVDPGDCEEDPLGCSFAPWTVVVDVLPAEGSDVEARDEGIVIDFHEAEVLDVAESRVHFQLELAPALRSGAHAVGVHVENDDQDSSNHLSRVVDIP
jgi:hypothetical protein